MRDYLLSFLRGLLGLEFKPKPAPTPLTFDFSISLATTPYPQRQAVLYENDTLRAWVVKSHLTDRHAIVTHIELRTPHKRAVDSALYSLGISHIATGGVFGAEVYTRTISLLDTDTLFSPQEVGFVVAPPPYFENYWATIERSTK